MKKIFSILMACIICFSIFSLVACDKNKCPDNCTSLSEQIVYKEEGGVVSIGKQCLTCGKVLAQETIEADYVVANANDVSTKQYEAEKLGKDCVIVLKEGEYSNVYCINRTKGRTHLIFETGVVLTTINVYADANRVTIENAHFYSEPGVGKGGGISFGTSGVLDDNGERNYMKVTIKNCSFYGDTNIARSWAPGMVEDMIIENCTFKNSVNASTSVFTPIFIAEIGGDTVIRNCVFDGAEYGMIRFGHYYRRGVTGTLLIENNVFINSIDERASCIMIHAQNGLEVTVRNNIFDDEKPCFFTYKRENENYEDSPFVADPSTITYSVEKNTWRVIPQSIENTSYYDITEQIQLEK